ncbi:polysaccharide deacetylase family protein [Candidatus Desulfosporosinus nitrosoreducens]|uniref:polysaccharide deacetylase family protein n=1 Tax=Candidatus Desulfosporosinus nitrosoreducens TaxID=3401928 RepID=UPI00280B097C|nr:polysaccharide deacetylase family protein [Desulfosporosinus sp. PR]
MNPNRKLIFGAASILVLLLIALTVRLLVPYDFESAIYTNPIKSDNDAQLTKSNKPALTPPAPSATVPPENKAKMVVFPQEGIPVLMYHSIKTLPGNSLGVPVKQFTEEMAWLCRQGYHSISPDDLYESLINQGLVPEKPILLTFDDGYSDNYSSAWPILRQYGFRATFFIITNSTGRGMMNWDQLSDLSKQGNTVASHTVHHLDLSKLSESQQEREMTVSKLEIESHLGVGVQSLCFPSGKYNKTTLALMPKAGYKLGFTTKPGKVYLGDNLLTLNRERIYGSMPMASFQWLFP